MTNAQYENGMMLLRRIESNTEVEGLTKREYFAAMAMQGLLANPERYKYITAKFTTMGGNFDHSGASKKNAHKAVLLADALIDALNEESK